MPRDGLRLTTSLWVKANSAAAQRQRKPISDQQGQVGSVLAQGQSVFHETAKR